MTIDYFCVFLFSISKKCEKLYHLKNHFVIQSLFIICYNVFVVFFTSVFKSNFNFLNCVKILSFFLDLLNRRFVRPYVCNIFIFSEVSGTRYRKYLINGLCDFLLFLFPQLKNVNNIDRDIEFTLRLHPFLTLWYFYHHIS